VASLLVSVRSGEEAAAAVAGGAAIIDIKEPRFGSLGRASWQTWREVRAVVPESIPVTAALGELVEWPDPSLLAGPAGAYGGIEFVKLGLGGAPLDWRDRWRILRDSLGEHASRPPFWVAAVYADWQSAGAPHPGDVLAASAAVEECRGILVDTWDKRVASCLGLHWAPFVENVRATGRFVALAGSLDREAIVRLAPLAPDIFAVRTAACAGGDRRGPIDPARVSLLRQSASTVPSISLRAG
jgi:(5-formylfuran-3-yl)methyl phosphate synthase